MSELDKERRLALIEVLAGKVQVAITATDLSFFDRSLLENAHVIALGG
jgi:recombinational DNA repair ATPase RecF